MPTYIIPPCRVSTDSLDTLDIPGLSVDANLYNTPLTEYPRIPWILWTSPDYPWMLTYNNTILAEYLRINIPGTLCNAN